MLKLLSCFVFLAFTQMPLAAEWQHNKSQFDPTGNVDLKLIDGLSKSVNSTGQIGLQSSSSPTVLLVAQGSALPKIKKHVRLTGLTGCSVLGRYGCPANSSVIPLGEYFDVARSVVLVTINSPQSDCAFDASWNCYSWSHGATALATLYDAEHVRLSSGHISFSGPYTTIYHHFDVTVDVYELEDLYVRSGVLTVFENSPVDLIINDGEYLFHSAANGGCNWLSNSVNAVRLIEKPDSQNVSFYMGRCPHSMSLIEPGRVSYFIAGSTPPPRKSRPAARFDLGLGGLQVC